MGLFPKIGKTVPSLTEAECSELGQIIAQADYDGEFEDEQVTVTERYVAVPNGNPGETVKVPVDPPVKHWIRKDDYRFRSRYALNHSIFSSERKAEISKHLHLVREHVDQPLEQEIEGLVSITPGEMTRHDGPDTKMKLIAELGKTTRFVPSDLFVDRFMESTCGKIKPSWSEFTSKFVRQDPPPPPPEPEPDPE